MSDSVVGRIVFNVFKFSLLIVSLLLFAIAYFFNKDNLDQEDWVETKAKVFRSQVIQKETRIAGRKAIAYDLDIKYGYLANKKRFDQQGLFAYNDTPKTLNKEFFIEQAKTYSKGSVVKAYYNPENPSQSYLLRNTESGAATFYDAIKKLLCVSLLIFLIQPILALRENKKLRRDLAKKHEFIIPDDARRIPAVKRGR